MPNRPNIFITLAVATVVAGCGGKSVMHPSPNAEATAQWNAARASAMSGLAADQLRDGNFDKCQATLDQVLRLTPDDVNLHLLAAKLSIEQGQLELAEAHLAKARALDPKRAETDYFSGLLLERWQKFDRAQAAYADAAAKNPAEPAYLLAQAETLVAMKKPTDALALLEAGRKTFEHNGVIVHEIGLLQTKLGRVSDGIDTLREACRLLPDDPTVREHLAFSLFASGRYADAAEVFDRLVKNDEYTKRPDVFAALGECLSRTQRNAEAQKAYDTATRLDAATPGYWLGLARVALAAGDMPTADTAIRRAVALRPADAPTQYLLGYVRLKQNLLPQALAAFKAASDIDPADGDAWCLQGYVLSQSSRPADAKACFARALAIRPDSPLAGRLLTSISPAD